MGRTVHTGHGVMLNPPKGFLMSSMDSERGRKRFTKAAADLLDLGRGIDIYSPEFTVRA